MGEPGINQLIDYLRNTFNPDPLVRKPAEKYLQSIEHSKGYSLLLLSLLQKSELPLEIRIACAVTFKNFVRRNWRQETGLANENSISEDDRSAVREQIISVMLIAPDAVRRQVSDAISLIGRQDFPDKWKALLPTLISQLENNSNDYRIVSTVLQTGHSLFKRYRHETKSNELWAEIKYVLDGFASPLTELMKKLVEEAKNQVAANKPPSELRPLFDCLVLVAKIFYSLNAQDLPEFFEDNIAVWMASFLELLKMEIPALVTTDNEEPGVVEQLKSEICENITMYAQKYEEEFSQCLPPFVDVVWSLLALCKYFEPKIINIFSGYIEHLFTEYAKDPEINWPRKDAAVFLVTSLASRGQTARHGTTKTSDLVNLADFFQSQIAPDFGGDINKFPVLKAAALKYLVTFRSHLSKEMLLDGMRAAVQLMKAESVVVHSYAAHALERICTMRNPSNPSAPLIFAADLEPIAQGLLSNLFEILEKEGSEENEYAMKCIMRSMTVLQESCVKFSEVILCRLTQKLLLVAKNPNKPLFNHYLFESLCVLIKQVCKVNPTENAGRFEAALFPPFQEILQHEVGEFMPYVFQILAMLLDVREANTTIPQPYMELFPFLLVPALWESLGNIPALVRLLRAYIKVGMAEIAAGNHLNALLGVFQRLIASKANDHEGFNILYSILEYSTWEQLKGSIKGILLLLFQRLQSSKTSKFVKHMITFIWLFALKQGTRELVVQVDDIQAGMFGMILEKIIIPDMQKVNGSLEKKICCVGVTRTLTESEDLLPGGKYSAFWVPLLQAVVGLFELPEEDSADDEQFLDVEAQSGYTTAYSQLAFASRNDVDPTGVADAKTFLAKALEKVAIGHPDKKIPSLVKQIDPRAAEFLLSYCRTAGVTLI